LEYIRGYSRLRSGHMHEHVRQYGYVGGKGNFHKSNEFSAVCSGELLTLGISRCKCKLQIEPYELRLSEYGRGIRSSSFIINRQCQN